MELRDPKSPIYLGLLQDSPCLCFLWRRHRSLLGIPCQMELKRIKKKKLYCATLWSNKYCTQEKPLTGNINMVPGGPRIPSAPGRPGRPGGPWQQRRAERIRISHPVYVAVCTLMCMHIHGSVMRTEAACKQRETTLNCCRNNAGNLIGTQYRWCTYAFENRIIFYWLICITKLLLRGKILKMLIWLTEWVHYLRTSNSF